MQTIIEMTKFAKSVLGKQKVEYTKSYRLMNFCMILDIDNHKIIFNNLTKQLSILSQEDLEVLEILPSVPIGNYFENLVENWFVVPIDFDECKLSEQLFKIYDNLSEKNYINSFVILTTTDCNARCFYCYEHGVTHTNMSEKTAEDISDYIINVSKGNDVTIKWFGGEPLYNEKVIDIISNKLRNNNIVYQSSMTSNAYLFTDANIKKAVELWNVKNIQITLDGTEDIYNRIKNYKHNNDISPFIKVTDNIEKILNANINVIVRLNVSDDNRTDIYDLVDYISERYKKYNNLHVYCSNLFDLKFIRTTDEISYLNQEFLKLDKYIHDKGLRKYNLNKWLNHERGCMAQRKNSVAISPLGMLGKCEHFSEGERMFGSIYSNIINKSAIDYWFEFKRIPGCKQCVIYPDCYGIGNCPDMSKHCDLAEKIVKENNLKNSITERYFEWKNSK